MFPYLSVAFSCEIHNQNPLCRIHINILSFRYFLKCILQNFSSNVCPNIPPYPSYSIITIKSYIVPKRFDKISEKNHFLFRHSVYDQTTLTQINRFVILYQTNQKCSINIFNYRRYFSPESIFLKVEDLEPFSCKGPESLFSADPFTSY